jgi:hypothetical protein
MWNSHLMRPVTGWPFSIAVGKRAVNLLLAEGASDPSRTTEAVAAAERKAEPWRPPRSSIVVSAGDSPRVVEHGKSRFCRDWSRRRPAPRWFG